MISIKSNKMRWAISTVLALLILFGTYRNVFSLAAFLLMGLMLAFCDRESNLLQMFFVMPMANIFKLAPGIQSFFTVILLAYVVIHLILPRRATFLVVIFAVYVVAGELLAGQFNLFRTIKLVCNILFLSSVLNSEVNIRHREISLSFIIGNVIASFWGKLDSSFFKIESYIGTQEFGNPNLDNLVVRFTGLYSDPNYYAVGMIISLCLLVVLFHRKEIKIISVVILVIPIIYFLIQTYSKSALIMLFVPLFFLIYSFYRKKNYFAVVVLIVSALIVVLLALSGQIPALDVVLKRMSDSETDEGFDANSFTTGRFNLWIMYASYLIKEIKIGLLGSGVGAGYLNERAAHNVYLDIFYFLGLVGGILLFIVLYEISRQSRRVLIKRNIMNYSVLLCVVSMYFFLSELFYFDPPFHIFLAFMVLDLPMNESCENKKTDISEEVL